MSAASPLAAYVQLPLEALVTVLERADTNKQRLNIECLVSDVESGSGYVEIEAIYHAVPRKWHLRLWAGGERLAVDAGEWDSLADGLREFSHYLADVDTPAVSIN